MNKMIIKSCSTILLLLLFLSSDYAQQIESSDELLKRIIEKSEQSNSDALLIYKEGEILVESYFGEKEKPVETMSVLKSIVSIAIGRLQTLQKLDSLDTPVYHFFPEWNQGLKKNITVLHLLNHTSGIQNVPNAGAEIYPAPDAIQLALSADLSDPPGEKFSYNNKAVNLLAGIIEKASGLRMDKFIEEKLFKPMEITQFKWYYDKAGNPNAMAGLQLTAKDLSKFGQLILNKGEWNKNPLINKKYISAMINPAQDHYPFCGLLWWLMPNKSEYFIDSDKIAEFESKGVALQLIKKLKPHVGKIYSSVAERNSVLIEALGERWYKVRDDEFRSKGVTNIFNIRYDKIVAYYAEGYLGQYLVVVPGSGIVAVRQVKNSKDYNHETDVFSEFMRMILQFSNTIAEVESE